MNQLNPKARLEILEKAFAALSNPKRRQILLVIHFRGDAVSAGDLASRFSCTWATTSGHLKVLEKAGLIEQTKSGRERLYSLNKSSLKLVRDWLNCFELDSRSPSPDSE